MHSKSLKLLPIWRPPEMPGWRQAQRVKEIRQRNTCHLSCPTREIFYGGAYVLDERLHCKSTSARNNFFTICVAVVLPNYSNDEEF
jgi:hypothetical protein